MPPRIWDLAVVGAGPAGSAAALAALHARPDLSVLLLDREDFPRDKACGDGIAPHVIDLLGRYDVRGIVDGQVPVSRLRLVRGRHAVARTMRRPAWVVPRTVFDARLVDAATSVGAELRRHRVRQVTADASGVQIDGRFRARVLIGADGAHSVVRARLGAARGRSALAIRGYAPVSPVRRGEQLIVFGETRQPSYAWSFDRGDGLANVGYGEVLRPGVPAPSRALFLDQLETLLPGSTGGGSSWRGHHLPLSSWGWRPAAGRVLLVGDAAGLVNPITGEGIYYAVATGLEAGGAAAAAVTHQQPESAGRRYRDATVPLLGRHLKHTALAARLCKQGVVLDAGLAAASDDQKVFDDLVELGLTNGRITRRVLRGLAREVLRGVARRPPGEVAA